MLWRFWWRAAPRTVVITALAGIGLTGWGLPAQAQDWTREAEDRFLGVAYGQPLEASGVQECRAVSVAGSQPALGALSLSDLVANARQFCQAMGLGAECEANLRNAGEELSQISDYPPLEQETAQCWRRCAVSGTPECTSRVFGAGLHGEPQVDADADQLTVLQERPNPAFGALIQRALVSPGARVPGFIRADNVLASVDSRGRFLGATVGLTDDDLGPARRALTERYGAATGDVARGVTEWRLQDVVVRLDVGARSASFFSPEGHVRRFGALRPIQTADSGAGAAPATTGSTATADVGDRADDLRRLFGIALGRPFEASGINECLVPQEGAAPELIEATQGEVFRQCLDRRRRSDGTVSQTTRRECSAAATRMPALQDYEAADLVQGQCWRRCGSGLRCQQKYAIVTTDPQAEQASILEQLGLPETTDLQTLDGVLSAVEAARRVSREREQPTDVELRQGVPQTQRLIADQPREDFGGLIVRRVTFGGSVLPDFINGEPVFLVDDQGGVLGAAMETIAERREQAFALLTEKYGEPSFVDRRDELLPSGLNVDIDTFFWERAGIVVRYLPVRSDTITYCCFFSRTEKSFEFGELVVYTRDAYEAVFGPPLRRRGL